MLRSASRKGRQGHLVLLVPGKNYGPDQLFLFETPAEALHFYESDLGDFECFVGDEHEPCGFEEVSLYEAGLRVATRACAPSARVEVCHESAHLAHRTGRKIVHQDVSEE